MILRKLSGLLAASLLTVPLLAASMASNGGITVTWHGPSGVAPGGQLVKGSLRITQNGQPWNGAVFLNPIGQGSSYPENIQLFPQGGTPDTLFNGLPTAQAQGQATHGILPLRWTQSMSPGDVQMSDRPWVGVELGATMGPGVNIESPTTFQTVVPAVKSLTVSAQGQSATSLAGLASVGNVPIETSCAWSNACPSSVPLTLSQPLSDTPTATITLANTGPQQTDSLTIANENENVPSSNAVTKTITATGTSTTITVALPIHPSDYGFNNRWLIEATPAGTAGHTQGMAAIYLYGTPKKPTTPKTPHSRPPSTTPNVPVHVKVQRAPKVHVRPTPTANLNLTIPAQATVGKAFTAHLALTGSHLSVSGQRIEWAVGPSGFAVPGATSTGAQGYTKDRITATQAGTATVTAKGPDGSSVSGQVKVVAPKTPTPPTPKTPTPPTPKKPAPRKPKTKTPKKPKEKTAKTPPPPTPTANLNLTIPAQATVGKPFVAHLALTGSHLSVNGQRIQWAVGPSGSAVPGSTTTGAQGLTKDTITADQVGTATMTAKGPDGSRVSGTVQVVAPKAPRPTTPKTPQTKTPKKPTPKKPTPKKPTPKKPTPKGTLIAPAPRPTITILAPAQRQVGQPIPATITLLRRGRPDAHAIVAIGTTAGHLSQTTGTTNRRGQIHVVVTQAPVGPVVITAHTGTIQGRATVRVLAHPFPWWALLVLIGLLAWLPLIVATLRRRRRQGGTGHVDPEQTL